MKAAAVFHYNWPTEFEYIWRRKGNLGCSLCHEFCLSCRAEHKFCVSFLQCKLGVCGSTIICGGASWRGILLVLSFSINCNEAIGYGGQNHESRVSLFIAIALHWITAHCSVNPTRYGIWVDCNELSSSRGNDVVCLFPFSMLSSKCPHKESS